jgi:hypothetical protein
MPVNHPMKHMIRISGRGCHESLLQNDKITQNVPLASRIAEIIYVVISTEGRDLTPPITHIFLPMNDGDYLTILLLSPPFLAILRAKSFPSRGSPIK